MKKLALILGIALVTAMCSPASASPVLGGQLFAADSNTDVTVEVLNASASYISELWLYAPGTPVFVATNQDTGTIVNLGKFSAGVELLFGIYVRNTGYTFYMGPGSRNPDGWIHAQVDYLGGGQATVGIGGFEDLYNGGDQDYNDCMFKFTNVVAPEPSALVVLASGLTGLGGLVLRRKR